MQLRLEKKKKRSIKLWAGFFGKINEIEKLLIRLRKKRKTQILLEMKKKTLQHKNTKKKIIKDYHEQ